MPDKLKRYRSKRDFARTGEPQGAVATGSGNQFMVHKHDATRLHYDLRLQIGGVFKSWAVPKGPSLDPRERRLAVEVEEHPLEYGSFEGVIPAGQYGAGTTLVWDRGTWAPMGDLQESLKSGTLKFRLAGEKLKGGWTLTRLRPKPGDSKNNWLLIKERDGASSESVDILDEQPDSVLSGRSIEELAGSGSRPKESPRRVLPGKLKGAVKAKLPVLPKPQLATPLPEPPAGSKWIHEIKFDGYRTLARIDGSDIRLITRNGHNWTKKYGQLAQSFSGIKCKQAVIDGEVVALDGEGVSRFSELQDALRNGRSERLVFFAFDLLNLDGWDLRNVALGKRKEALRALLGPLTNSPILYSEHVVGQGAEFYEKACERGLEGVVSKQIDSAYRAGRTKTWTKSKSLQAGSFLIAGYTKTARAGGLAALHLAENVEGELRYAGKVSSGLGPKTAAGLEARLRRDAVAAPAVEGIEAGDHDHWVHPRLRASVHFAERTPTGRLRHAIYKGLREIPAKDGPATTTGRLVTDLDLANIWVTNPDRRMFSASGPTKLDLALYYAKVGDAMLPHILGRPISLLRCQSGKAEECFFQRHPFEGMPEGIGIHTSAKADKENRKYLVVEEPGAFLALAQFGVVEFHPWGCRRDKPERPDRLIFDLDPGEGVSWRGVREAAQIVREAIERLGLVSFVKTTGGKGLHLVVPIKRTHSWAEMRNLGATLASDLALLSPDRFTTSVAKKQRRGLIYLDNLRNVQGATAVGPYSVRARRGLPVSTPLTWEELASIDDPADLNYNSVPDLLSRRGDPWVDLDANAVSLASVADRRSKKTI